MRIVGHRQYQLFSNSGILKHVNYYLCTRVLKPLVWQLRIVRHSVETCHYNTRVAEIVFQIPSQKVNFEISELLFMNHGSQA